MTAPRSDSDLPQERGEILGYSLIAIIAALTLLAFRAGAAEKPVVMGAYLIAWGLMFVGSYYFSHKTFFLRGLRWFCVNWSVPGTPKMAFFYAGVMSAMGVVSILSGLGVV